MQFDIRSLFFIKFYFLAFTIFLVGCASNPVYTPYELNSNPQGADIYRGTSPDNLTYYQTTPFSLNSPGSLSWSLKYFQARKQGYKNSAVYHQPTSQLGTPTGISFTLESNGGREVYEQYKKFDTLDHYYKFLDLYPDSPLAQDAYRAMVLLISGSIQADEQYTSLVDQYPDAIDALPSEVRLAHVGPPDMRVRDIQAHQVQGIGSVIIAQKILSAGEPYAEFSFDEIKQLTDMGLDDEVIAAMLKVTKDYNDAQKSSVDASQNSTVQQRQGLRQNEVAVTPGSGTSVGQVIQDKATDCAAYLVKREACDQLGFFAGKICMAAIPAGHNCF